MTVERYSLLKPYKALAEVNEQFRVEDLIKQMDPDMQYSLEPKIDGMSIQIHKDSSGVRILTETADLADKFPYLREEIEKNQWEEFVVHAELVRVDLNSEKRFNFLPHEEIVGLANQNNVHEGRDVIAVGFDLLSFRGAEYYKGTILHKRKLLLSELYEDSSNVFFSEIPSRVVYANEEVLNRTIEEMTTDEGIMLKGLSSKYDREGSKTWFKLKWLHEVDVQVIDKRLVKNSKCTYNYIVGLLNDKGELQNVGRTMNSNVQAEVGDILTVRCDRIIPYDSTYGLYLARVKEKRDDKTVPDSFALLRQRSAQDDK
jgi:ATP-dependent DNA ligase